MAGPFHDIDVDSEVSEPALHELRSVLRIIVLLEFVEQGPVSLPIRQKNKHKKKSKSGKNCAYKSEFSNFLHEKLMKIGNIPNFFPVL